MSEPVTNELHLKITGRSGKSTIARLVKTALEQAGVKVTLRETGDDARIEPNLTVHVETALGERRKRGTK